MATTTGTLKEAEKMEALKQQLAADFISILTEGIEDKCFALCITKPSSKLERNEEACLGKCMVKFMQSWDIASSVIRRISDKISNGIPEKTENIELK